MNHTDFSIDPPPALLSSSSFESLEMYLVYNDVELHSSW
jgi:hypothetical protein